MDDCFDLLLAAHVQRSLVLLRKINTHILILRKLFECGVHGVIRILIPIFSMRAFLIDQNQ